ncbi:hypothetical protein Tco_1025449 [Tanacetum coccineum]
MKEKVREFGSFDNDTHQGYYNTISRHSIHPVSVTDSDFLTNHGLARNFFDNINTDAYTGPQWANLFQMNKPVFCELVWEFFAFFEFSFVDCRYDLEAKGVTYRLSRGETVNAECVLTQFWPTIGDDEFVVGGMAIKKVRDPRVRLAHRSIATTISGRKESTQRITLLDLFFLYCIYGEGVTSNIHHWLALYLERVKDTDLIVGEMCCWPATRQVKEDEEVEEAANEEAGDSTEVYQNMSRGDWQEEQANWMYDHTVRHLQYLSIRDNLDPHLQIDPFPVREADYPPYGYTGHMPPGYVYRFGPASPGGSE